jgi:hypothetical protein
MLRDAGSKLIHTKTCQPTVYPEPSIGWEEVRSPTHWKKIEMSSIELHLSKKWVISIET